ncbi:ORF6C domain-containing protein [Schinkia azotoformans]|uniref:Prophage pi2 protein 06 n=1 Tax=Schinkia azotoformans LMG 9581 TaxID=1131731 RepID=K6DI95_SCHAZ|nr:ORF6N domain-containing protein [Schinkia azotoformans]EKN67843.1 prophage pi2 protein 06 [Schinkia azotoformans LMG 9581]MEC1637391.1 ORF6C domain-containing protein [Schinkia azotoformans]MEC1943795.1 ORF6C domain-containing protein [Schinkia azotoformans]
MELQVIEKNGFRVLASTQLAEAYGTEPVKIQQNFNNNKNRYKEGKHFILLQGDELKEFKRNFENFEVAQNVNKLYLWTEKGAWLHAKSLNTDKAWDAFELLVDAYYTVKEQVKVLSEREQLIASMKLTIETQEEVGQLKGEMKEIRLLVEEQITLDHGEQRKVQKTVAKRVYDISDDSEQRSAYFREIYREIKDRFGVASYKDIKRKDINSALRYIEAWIPRKSGAAS